MWRSFFVLNTSLLEVVGEDCGDSGIGIGDAGWVDFGDDGVGLVEVADLASISGAADEVFDDVGVNLRAVRADFDVVEFSIITT